MRSALAACAPRLASAEQRHTPVTARRVDKNQIGYNTGGKYGWRFGRNGKINPAIGGVKKGAQTQADEKNIERGQRYSAVPYEPSREIWRGGLGGRRIFAICVRRRRCSEMLRRLAIARELLKGKRVAWRTREWPFGRTCARGSM